MRYQLKQYSEHQIKNWANSKSIVVYRNDVQLRHFIQNAIDGHGLGKKMYFGSIPSNLADRVKTDTGLNVEGYNCTLRASEVRKIISDHGSEHTETPRGQRAITVEDLMSIPEIIQSPDEIRRSVDDFEGKPVIEFVKTINGRTTVVAYVSGKHLDLTVQTMYSGKSKGNLATAAGDQAPANTPEANVGTVPKANVHPDGQEVKEKFSLKGQQDLMKENARLREVNQTLRDQFKTTAFAKVDRKFGTTSCFDLAGYLIINGTLPDISKG